MKTLHRVVGLIAAIAVATFVVSLILLAGSDGNHDSAALSCKISLLVSFVSLIVFEPSRLREG